MIAAALLATPAAVQATPTALPVTVVVDRSPIALGGGGTVVYGTQVGNEERRAHIVAYQDDAGAIIVEITLCNTAWVLPGLACEHHGGPLVADQAGKLSIRVVEDGPADNARVTGSLPGFGDIDVLLVGDEAAERPEPFVCTQWEDNASFSMAPATTGSRITVGGAAGAIGPWTIWGSAPCGAWGTDVALVYGGR